MYDLDKINQIRQKGSDFLEKENLRNEISKLKNRLNELETTISESSFKTLSKEEYEKLPRSTKKQIQKLFEKIRNDWFFSQRKPNITNYEYLEEENRRLKEENESLKRQINGGVNIEKVFC